jgi:hypothetical protein
MKGEKLEEREGTNLSFFFDSSGIFKEVGKKVLSFL